VSWFQIIVLPLLGLLFAGSVRRLVKSGARRLTAFINALIWLGAAVAIAWPGLTTRVANSVGIGRGADLVLYFVALASLLLAFYFYSRLAHLESDISKIVRHLAIQAATERHEPAVLRQESAEPYSDESPAAAQRGLRNVPADVARGRM